MRTRLFIFYIILLSGLGCSQDSSTPNSPAQNPSEVVETDQELYCNSESKGELNGVIETCLSDETEILKSYLTRHLHRLSDSAPSWSARYLETRNFNRRYGLTTNQLQCLKQNLCKEYL